VRASSRAPFRDVQQHLASFDLDFVNADSIFRRARFDLTGMRVKLGSVPGTLNDAAHHRTIG
jgi:hypothetical protein